MLREVDINEISDGNRYNKDSMVKIGCNECKGCSECCRDMGNSIVLDPYDIYQLTHGLKCDFAYLMNEKIELNVVDGIICPNIVTKSGEACGFLNSKGRCSIHDFRPGFCRLFPLGRIYEDGGFSYFHQIHECPYPSKTKVKVKKWLDIPSLGEYEKYILCWHDFLKKQIEILDSLSLEQNKELNLLILNIFFIQPYDFERDFYEQFYDRLRQFHF